MLVTIILATRNRHAALRETLAALSRIRLPDATRLELIVADNGSTDATREAVAGASPARGRVRHLWVPTPGKASALNAALRVAAGEVIVFTDDDVRPATDWLERLIEPLAQHRFDAVSGTVRIAPHLLRPWMTPTHRAWLAETDYIDPSRPLTAVGANMAISRRVLERVPRFDTELGPGRLGLWEDTLFSQQLIEAGYRLGFVTDAVVEHHFDPSRLSRKAFLSHAVNEGRSSAYVAWHWRHEDECEASRSAAAYRLRLLAKRLLHRSALDSEGAPTWEMNLVCAIAQGDQFRREQLRRRQYERLGTAKLGQRLLECA